MQITLVKEGLLAKGALNAWSARVYDKAWNAVRMGMQTGGAQIAGQMRAHVQTALKGKGVANSIRHKVFARKRNELPTLQIRSKIPWLMVHERGATINGKLLIPFGSKRMRRQAWRKFIDQVFQDGRAFFRRIRGRDILFVIPAGKGDQLTRYRKSYREKLRSRGGSTRIARNRPIPVAVRVTRITIKRRLNTKQIALGGLSLITRGSRAAS